MSQHKEENFFTWAYSHSNNAHPKYSTKIHALYQAITGTLIFVAITFTIRFWLFSNVPQHQLKDEATYAGCFYLVYLLIMISTRFYENGPVAIY